ncbi:hypothetical protein P7C73_g4250, partial [Tremellales sp. Uapishka_1]
MLFYFVRHGQTDHNVRGIIQGQMDTPLNDHGRREAALVAHALRDVPFTEAWTSSLSRAAETAQIIMQYHDNVPLYSHPLLIERGLGSMEGRRRLKGEKAPKDAESSQVFSKRVTRWLDGFLASHMPASGPLQGDKDATVLVLSHGAYLGQLLSLLLSPVYGFKLDPGVDLKKSCLNTSIMRVSIEIKDGQPEGVVLSWGEVGHLKELLGEELEIADVVDDEGKGRGRRG